MRRLWDDYRDAYRDCSAWLARWCPPWRWLVEFYRVTRA